MTEPQSVDDAVVQNLPLPLAQLCRRVQCAKGPREQHDSAYYLWEASLKLLASVAVIEYAELEEHDPELVERLKSLSRPSLGHWWEFVRRLVPVLADRGHAGFGAVRELVLGRAHDDMPRAAGLDAALRDCLEGRAGARSTVRLTELFDRMVTYRNREYGHGAAGQKELSFYENMAGVLTAGVVQVLSRLDVLAGHRLIYVGDVRRSTNGGWLIERYDLTREFPKRIESLVLPENDTARLPHPERTYFEIQPAGSGGEELLPTLRSLDPLLHYDTESRNLFFLTAPRGKKQIEYLCYTTGAVIHRESSGQEQRELLAKILGRQIDARTAEQWAAESLADEPSSAPAPESTLRSVGEFELLSRLGRGGMGVVYRAWQPSLARQVAIKCMLRTGDPVAEARFAREICALGRIEHPNVVKVFTSGTDGEQWFFAMELIEGTELGSVCDQLVGSSAAEIDEAHWLLAVSTACDKARSQETQLSAPNVEPLLSSSSPAAAAPDSVPRTNIPPVGRLYVNQVVDIIRLVAEAAHALHESGVIHRDIKPGNIMLTAQSNHPVLMDLGLAQIADESDGRLTRTRQFIGTARYASPEQILAVGAVDRRTDVYSLGATLWELLTLRPMFAAGEGTPTPELMLKIQTCDPESPRRYNRHVPRDLEAILLKCLDKDRERRYATARELAADLDRWQRGEPVVAQPPSLSYISSKFVRRHRWPLGFAAAVAVLVFGGTIAAFFQINGARHKAEGLNLQLKAANGELKSSDRTLRAKNKELATLNQREQAATQKAQDNLDLAKTKNLEIRRLAYSLNMQECQRLFRDGRLNDARAILQRDIPQVGDTDVRSFTWRYLAGLFDRTGRQLNGHTHVVTAVSFSGDGKTLASGSLDGTVCLWDVASGRLKALLEPVGPVWDVKFSPVDDILAVASKFVDGTERYSDAYEGVAFIDAATGLRLAAIRLVRDAAWSRASERVRNVAFSPDGTRLAMLGRFAELNTLPPDRNRTPGTWGAVQADEWRRPLCGRGRFLETARAVRSAQG